MKFVAFLKDSLRETMDKKSFWVLGILAILFVFLCFSISFTKVEPKEALNDLVSDFGRVVGGSGQAMTAHKFDTEFTVNEIEALGEEADHLAGGYQFQLMATPLEEFYRAVYQDRALRKGDVEKASEMTLIAPDGDIEVPEPLEKDQIKYLKRHFSRGGFPWPKIERTSPGVFQVQCKPAIEQQVRGGYKMGILFGLWDLSLRGMSVNSVVMIFQLAFAEYIAGFFGVILALIFTASFIPGMLEKGNIEILVSKPIHRSSLLVYKYVGGLLYVFLLSVILIGGSWLALSLRSGFWNPTYLYSIGVQTFYFAILYSVSVLFGVLWRSWIGSILMTILAWIVFTGSCTVYSYVHMPIPLFELSPFWLSVVDTLYYILPKPSHLSTLNILELASANLGETMMADSGAAGEIVPEGVSWTMVLSTSSAFIVAMLGLSCWRFSRKDY